MQRFPHPPNRAAMPPLQQPLKPQMTLELSPSPGPCPAGPALDEGVVRAQARALFEHWPRRLRARWPSFEAAYADGITGRGLRVAAVGLLKAAGRGRAPDR